MTNVKLDSCQRCNNCCTNFGVCLTIFDISRIARETGRNPISFVDLVDDYSPRERTEPAIILNHKKYVLVLKHEQKQEKEQEKRVCTFFKSGGCSIYESRPYLCRTYPFILDQTQKGELKDLQNRACVVFWYPKGEAKEKYVTDLKIYFKQIEEYKKIVDKWNNDKSNNSKGLSTFLKFALKEI
ncbi:MAG: YkgJ family cysteine cluster protein [Candidatus Micrarchaeota archaeon]